MSLFQRIANHYRVAYCNDHFPSLRELLLTRKRILVYYGFLGDANFGDELVYEAAKDLFREAAVLLPVRHHMPIHISAFVRMFHRKLQGIVIGGGTLIGPLWDRAFYERLIAEGAPVYVHGTGVRGHIEAEDGWRGIFSKGYFGGVRGPKSQENTKGLIADVPMAGDAAFEMFRADASHRQGPREKVVLINLGTHDAYNGSKEARIALRGFLKHVLEHGYVVHFIPCHEVDVQLARGLTEEFPAIQVLPVPLLYAEALPHFETAAFAIGERLHFTAMAILGGCPFVSINYAAKHEDLLASLALDETGAKPSELTATELIHRFDARGTTLEAPVTDRLVAFREFQQAEAGRFLQAIAMRPNLGS